MEKKTLEQKIIEEFKIRYLPVRKVHALNLNGESVWVNVLDLLDFIRHALHRQRLETADTIRDVA